MKAKAKRAIDVKVGSKKDWESIEAGCRKDWACEAQSSASLPCADVALQKPRGRN